MVEFILFAVAVIAYYIFYNNKKKKKEEELRQKISSYTTAAEHVVLTPQGIPAKGSDKYGATPIKPSGVDIASLPITHSPQNPPEKELPTVPPTQPPKAPIIHPRTAPVSGPAHGYSAYTALIGHAYDPTLRRIEMEYERSPELCVICGSATLPDSSRITLSNGLHVHVKCNNAMRKAVRMYKRDADIPGPDSKYYTYVLGLMLVNKYWPDYPDDWEQRKSYVLRNAEYECESCGEDSKPLHAHHRKPLSAGGSNALDNLMCLCEDCHSEFHGRDLTNDIDYKKGKNRTMIDKAMNDGLLVEFTYKDTKGEYTHRTAKPLRYISSPHRAPSLRAFCYLRNEERTFVIRKMSKMKVK